MPTIMTMAVGKLHRVGGENHDARREEQDCSDIFENVSRTREFR